MKSDPGSFCFFLEPPPHNITFQTIKNGHMSPLTKALLKTDASESMSVELLTHMICKSLAVLRQRALWACPCHSA